MSAPSALPAICGTFPKGPASGRGFVQGGDGKKEQRKEMPAKLRDFSDGAAGQQQSGQDSPLRAPAATIASLPSRGTLRVHDTGAQPVSPPTADGPHSRHPSAPLAGDDAEPTGTASARR